MKPEWCSDEVWALAASLFSEAVMLNEIGQKKAFARALLEAEPPLLAAVLALCVACPGPNARP